MRRVLIVLILLTGGLVLSIGPLFLQETPSVAASPPPSAEDVAATRDLFRDIRAATQGDTASARIVMTDALQLNSAMRLGARFVKGFRGQVTTTGNVLRGEMSIPLPWWQGERWLNLSGSMPAFDGTLALRDITVGPTRVSPAFALGAARTGANLIFGNRFGDTIVQAVQAMTISGEEIAFRLNLDGMGKNGLMQSAFGTLRGTEMPGPQEIEAYHREIRAAMAAGDLPETGSFLPYLRFALDAAYENSTSETLPNAYTAAIFGLAKACGAKEFALIVGRLAFDVADFSSDWPARCDAVTFNGRVDSRRHFITSAALQAASNRGFSVSVGEFKELYDTISGAGGFDFTDMAANLSGIRLSNVLMTTPRADWPARLARLETENDVIVAFDGIPHLMPDTEFAARYGDIDSPAYREMIARIEAGIDALDLYQGP